MTRDRAHAYMWTGPSPYKACSILALKQGLCYYDINPNDFLKDSTSKYYNWIKFLPS
jgi:hypothetical protein